MFLALRGELINTIVITNDGEYRINELIDYDSLTNNFTLRVQNTTTLVESIREFSDKYRYDVIQSSRREYPNDKRLKPLR